MQIMKTLGRKRMYKLFAQAVVISLILSIVLLLAVSTSIVKAQQLGVTINVDPDTNFVYPPGSACEYTVARAKIQVL